MQNKFFLSMILLILSAFIINPGCGGGNETATSINLTPLPNNSDNTGYIHIKVKWPDEVPVDNKTAII